MFYITFDLGISDGTIDDITSTLTFKQFNVLEKKFQEGFGRYYNEQLTSENIGEWLCRISNDECFKHITSIEEIFQDNLCHNKLRNDENLKLVLVNSTILYTKQLSDEVLCELLPAMLSSITSTEKATGLTIQNTKLDYIFGNLASMLAISKSEPALTCLMQSENGFKGFVASEYYAAVCTSPQVIDATVKVLEFYRQYAINLKTMQDDLAEALKCGDDISHGALWSKEIQDLHGEVTVMIDSLRTSVEPVANTIANGKDLLTSSQIRKIFVDNAQTADTLFAYDSFCDVFFTKGGAAAYYANNDPLVIYKLLAGSNHFREYVKQHASVQTDSNTYNNGSKPFIITAFNWEYDNAISSTSIKTTGKNYYRLDPDGLKIVTSTVTLSDPEHTGLSGYNGNEIVFFRKDGVYAITASGTSRRTISYYVFE
jgi:hypothetical protein